MDTIKSAAEIWAAYEAALAAASAIYRTEWAAAQLRSTFAAARSAALAAERKRIDAWQEAGRQRIKALALLRGES